MGKPIERSFETEKTILKFFDFKGAACVVSDSLAITVGDKKIVKGGTPYPANSAACKGYILQDVDVTMGDAPATYVFEGSIDEAKVTANGITVESAAKNATPRVTFF